VKKFEEILNKINFKKAIKLYITISIILVLICSFTMAYLSRSSISMAIGYNKAAESFEKTGLTESVKSTLSKLAADSKDVVNIIAVDKDNNILFKANSNLINSDNKFILTPYEANKKYLKDEKGTLYKVVKSDNIVLNKNYLKNHEKEVSDINEESYYERDMKAEKINMVNYLVKKDTKDKVFIVRNATPIPYMKGAMEAFGIILGLIFMVYWVGLALWVYKDANKKKMNPALWGLVALLTNLVGLIIYSMYKQNNKLCHQCGSLQSKENIFCTLCGEKLNESCEKCGNIVGKNDSYCSKCGNKL